MLFEAARSTSGIPCLENYEQALAHYNSVKPIRGRAVECRPLGHRDRPRFSIQLNDKQEVECCEYGSPIITFRSNGEVLLTTGTLRALSIFEKVLGIKSKRVNDQIHFFLNDGVFIEPSKAGLLTGLVIKRDLKKNNNYYPVGLTPNVVHHIRRQEANKIRAQYSDILEYADEYFKLGTPMPSEEQMGKMFGFNKMKYRRRPNIEINISEMQFAEFVEFANKYFYSNTPIPSDEDLKDIFESEKAKHQNRPVRTPELLGEYNQVLIPNWDYANPDDINVFISWMRSEKPYDRHKAMAVLRNRARAWKGNKEHQEVMLIIDRMILAKHKDEVFKKVEVPVGTVRKDMYCWAF